MFSFSNPKPNPDVVQRVVATQNVKHSEKERSFFFRLSRKNAAWPGRPRSGRKSLGSARPAKPGPGGPTLVTAGGLLKLRLSSLKEKFSVYGLSIFSHVFKCFKCSQNVVTHLRRLRLAPTVSEMPFTKVITALAFKKCKSGKIKNANALFFYCLALCLFI